MYFSKENLLILRTTALSQKEVHRVVYVIGLTSLLTDIATELLASILTVYLYTVLMLSPLQIGFLDGFYLGGAALLRLLTAWYADKSTHYKRLAWLGYLLSTIAKLGLLLSMSFGALFAFVALFADRVGKAIRTAPRDALIAAHTSQAQLGAAFGVHRAMDAMGAVLGPLLAIFLLWWSPENFRLILWVSIVFAAMGVLVFSFGVTWPAKQLSTSAGHNDKSADNEKLTMGALANMLKSNRFFLQLVVLVFLLSCVTISDNLLYLILQQKLYLLAHQVPMLYLCGAMVFLLTAKHIGTKASAVGYGKVYLLGHVVLLLAYVCLASEGAHNYVSLAIVVGVVGLHYAATDGILAIICLQLVPGHARVSALAVVATAVALGKLLSSTLFGFIWQKYSILAATYTFAVLMLLVLIVATFFLKRLKIENYAH